MKTKIKQFFEKISLLFAIIFLSSLVYQTTYGAAVVDESSAIKYVDYKIEWCSPHHANLLNGTKGFNASTSCIEKKLSGSNSILDYDGNNLVGLTDKSSINTTKGLKGAVVDFFKRSGLSLEAEGILKIKIKLLDNADNATSYELTYKIDKTAPQFIINSMTENSSSAYYSGKLPSLTKEVKKNDSLNLVSNDDFFPIPDNITPYTGNLPVVRSNNRTGIQTIYYKDEGTNFNINVDFNDIFIGIAKDDSLKNTIVNFVSNSHGTAELYKYINGGVTKKIDLSVSDTGVININTTNLGLATNSNGFFKIRLYDDTVPRTGSKPNYSEIVFYAVRDNTAPNVGPDSITFGTVSAFPTGSALPNINSKYFYADADFEIGYDFKDTGINACGINHALCNVGLAEIDFRIDKAVVTGGGGGGGGGGGWGGGGVTETMDNYPLDTSGKHTANGNIVHDFSKVDNTGSKTYSTNIKSRSGLNQNKKICDLVGNCTSINPTFRVIAGPVDTDESKIAVAVSDLGNNGMIAGSSDKYSVNYELKDEYGNIIKDVTSVRKVELETKLNMLEKDQTKGTGSIVLKSGYSFDVTSYVPTVDFYPYLDISAKIYIDSIDIDDTIIANSSIFFGTEAGPLPTINPTGSDLITIGGGLNEDPDDYVVSKGTDYGKVNLTNSSVGLSSKTLNFPFASPIAFEMTGFTGSLADSSPILMTKNIKNNIGGTNIDNYVIYEKLLMCEDGENEDIADVDKKCTNQQYSGASWSKLATFKVKSDSHTGTVDFGSSLKNGTFSLSQNAFDKNTEPNDVINGFNYKTNYQVTPIIGSYSDSANLRSGYVSVISYKIGDKTVTLPATGRAISPNGGLSGHEKMTINYFKDQYSLAGGVELTEDIAITGMANKYLNPTNDHKASQARTDIGGNLLRYDLMTTFKSNAKKLSGGIEWCDIDEITNFGDLSALSSCKATKSGEDIYFIDNDLEINCPGHCVIPPNKNISIVVRNGNITINSNISSAGNNGRLLLGAYNEMPLVSFSISDVTSNSNSGGWIFVEDNVTNIDALVLSHGPIMPVGNYHIDDYTGLENQLHIYGGLLSLNTIRGSFEDPAKCPHIINEGSCDIERARLFDLVFLRRYKEGSGGTPSGGSSGTCGTNNSYNASTGLRCITNDDFKKYPMFIERNTTWDNKPSELMR